MLVLCAMHQMKEKKPTSHIFRWMIFHLLTLLDELAHQCFYNHFDSFGTLSLWLELTWVQFSMDYFVGGFENRAQLQSLVEMYDMRTSNRSHRRMYRVHMCNWNWISNNFVACKSHTHTHSHHTPSKCFMFWLDNCNNFTSFSYQPTDIPFTIVFI